jgi:hypothetical protein
MPVINNITQIPAPRVDFIDQRTGLMSREWYRFFLNLFTLTGSGSNDTAIEYLNYVPLPQPSTQNANDFSIGQPVNQDIYAQLNDLSLGPIGQPIPTNGVTQVNTGTGLNGGPIVTTGTIAISNTTVTPGNYTAANITVNAQGQLTAASNGPSGSVTQVNTGTGLTGGPITTTGTVLIANTGVAAGTYTSANITVNAQGQLTFASNGSTGGTVVQVNTGTGLTGGPITTSGTIAIDNTVVTLTGTQTLSNKTITGLASGSTVNDIAGNLYEFGFRIMPQSSNASGTLVLSDSAKHLYLTGNVTVPPNSSVPFDIGTVISVISNATSLIIQAGSGVTLKLANSASAGDRSVASNGVATMIKVATDTWYVFGVGVG